MPDLLQALILDDLKNEISELTAMIQPLGLNAEFLTFSAEAAFRAALGSQEWDLIISNPDLAGFPPERVLALLAEMSIDIPVIVIADEIDYDKAAAFIKAGAADCISRPFLDRLPLAIYREMQRKDKFRALRADLELRESRFLSLFNNMAEGVALHELDYDPRGRAINYYILDCNPQFENILKIKREDAIGRIATDVYALPAPPFLAEYASCVESQTPHQFNAYVASMNKHFAISVTPWGQNSFATIFTDISEHQQTVAALRESERQLSTLMNNLPGIVYYASNDQNWTTEFVSEGCAELTGYTSREIIDNRSIAYNDVIHPDDREGVRQAIQAGIASKTPYAAECRIVTKNGSIKHVLDRGQGIYGDNGKLLRLDGLVIDISDRKKAEEERDRLNVLLKNIIDSMPSVLIAIDRNGLVTRWNAEAARQTGCSAEQALELPIAEALPMFANHIDRLRLALDEQKSERGNRVVQQSGNENRYFEIMIYPLISSQVEGAVVRVDDITDKVLLQEMMIQTEKMMSVGGLAAGMAHELNNPLSGILQAAQNIENRLSPGLGANHAAASRCGVSLEHIRSYIELREIDHMLKGIRESGKRAADIISSMLQFSRRSEARKMPVNLADLLDRTIEIAAQDFDMQTGFDFRHIDIVRQYDALMGDVYCYPNEIEQVILNILKNAARAVVDSCHQDLKPRLILRTGRDEGMAVIEVEDNGPGISGDAHRRIFEPFYTTKPPGQGTGLGLSVSYFIITSRHQGQITVKSKPGQGTTVAVCLPAHPGAGLQI